MPECTAAATWYDTLSDGEGAVELGSGAWAGEYGIAGATDGSDPEELLAGAHASCFAMTVSYVLEESGFSPERVRAESVVTIDFLEGELDISSVDVVVSGTVPDATADEVAAAIERAERACPVSKALAGTTVDVSVRSPE